MANNLLDKSSIILTPTAYNNGEALCVKPSDGSGDFQFSRNSAATRVNAQGLVENVQILSSNLVQNGDFSEEGVQEVSNGSFSQEGVEEITNGDFSNGETDWDFVSTSELTEQGARIYTPDGSYTIVVQNNVLVVGKQYKVTFDVIATDGSSLSNGSGSVVYDTSTIGSKVFYITTDEAGFALKRISGITDVTITNISVREVGQDWNLSSQSEIVEDAAKVVSTDGSFQYIKQNGFTSTQGKTIKFTIEVTDIQIGQLKVSFTGGTTNTNIPNSVGTHILYIPNDGSIGELTIGRISGITDVTITNISVKEVGQNWNLGSGWSIGNGVAISDGVSADSNLNTNNIGYSVGDLLKVSFSVSNVTGGTLQIGLGATQTYSGITDGDYEFITTATRPDGKVFFKSVLFNGSITNISVIEITDDTNLPRINYEGFSYQDALGSEEVVNGDFSNGSTDWTLGAGWSIADGKLIANNATGYALQGGVFASGVSKTYKIDLTISDYVSGYFTILTSGGTAQSQQFSANGNYTIYFDTNNPSGTTFHFTYFGSFTGSIDNVSVKEYLGQEVVPESGCGSWLWEPQSTNVITQSELFSDASWLRVGSITTTDNYTTSPSGQNNGTRLQWTNATNYIYQSLSHVGSDFTLSIYLKSNTDVSQNVRLFMDNGAQAKDVVVTTQWQRFELTNTTTPTQSNRNVGLIKSYGQVGNLDISIWGAQFEALSYPTSLIPTSGATVTRNQDICINGGSLASINSTEGVLYAEIAALANDLTNRTIALSDGTVSNTIRIQYLTVSNAIWATVTNIGAGGNQAVLQYTSPDITINSKVALKYKANDFSLWVNGIEVATDTSGVTFSANTLNTLQFDRGNGAQNFFGKTKALAVFPYLSDSELQSLTTI